MEVKKRRQIEAKLASIKWIQPQRRRQVKRCPRKVEMKENLLIDYLNDVIDEKNAQASTDWQFRCSHWKNYTTEDLLESFDASKFYFFLAECPMCELRTDED